MTEEDPTLKEALDTIQDVIIPALKEERPLDEILRDVETVLAQDRAENLPPKDFPTAKAVELLFIRGKLTALNKAVKELEDKRDRLEELIHPAFGLSGTDRVVVQGMSLRPSERITAVAKQGNAALVETLIKSKRVDMLQACTARLSSWVAELEDQRVQSGEKDLRLPPELAEHILVLKKKIIGVRKV